MTAVVKASTLGRESMMEMRYPENKCLKNYFKARKAVMPWESIDENSEMNVTQKDNKNKS